ncbi:hypothetical protein SAMN06297164_0632 [Nitrosomonas ureae]|uniref:Uncharacterized protein n=2 Tax=Nitrosomonas ureae TaxID=44577 RepID=A0A286A3R8_9PROT|nr:hypothetical protein SAMN06297164_0632 [Nitrosomonas ureae]
MDTYELLLDQISPFLESQFSNLPEDLKERISRAGMGEKTNKKYCSEVEEFDWVHIEAGNKSLTDDEAKEVEEGEGIRKGKGIRSKIKTEHYYIWDTLSALQREYKVARYDFKNFPGFREKVASSILVEAITPYLQTKFSDLPREMRMNIAYVDIFQKWDEISTDQRKQMASDFDARMQPGYENSVNIGYIIESFNIKEHWHLFAQKKTLLADEAIPLMNGLDPDSWEEYKKNEKGLPKDMIRSIERYLKIALADGLVKCAPSEWLVWGRFHDLDKLTIRLHEWLPVTNVCMWEFFESAVNKHVEETTSHFNSNTKQVFKQSKSTISKSAGRPKSVATNAAILKEIIVILTEGKNINHDRLPGNAGNLHDACKRITREKSKKNMFNRSLSTFKEWLKAAGYRFGNGRTPSIEANYWTDLCVKNTGKIDSGIFTKYSGENLL